MISILNQLNKIKRLTIPIYSHFIRVKSNVGFIIYSIFMVSSELDKKSIASFIVNLVLNTQQPD